MITIIFCHFQLSNVCHSVPYNWLNKRSAISGVRGHHIWHIVTLWAHAVDCTYYYVLNLKGSESSIGIGANFSRIATWGQ